MFAYSNVPSILARATAVIRILGRFPNGSLILL
jgi:hypothetical protein